MIDKYLNKLDTKGEIYLRIKAHPNSPSTKITEILSDDTIKIDIAAVPDKNKANKELIKFLTKTFKTSQKNVTIISGIRDSLKLIKIVKKHE